MTVARFSSSWPPPPARPGGSIRRPPRVRPPPSESRCSSRCCPGSVRTRTGSRWRVPQASRRSRCGRCRERLVPMARDVGVTIAVEEVWNKFLLSPLEFARYVDEFESPRVRAYFDVGNVVIHGYPQDWIRTLGPRIAKIHLKDFNFDRAN